MGSKRSSRLGAEQVWAHSAPLTGGGAPHMSASQRRRSRSPQTRGPALLKVTRAKSPWVPDVVRGVLSSYNTETHVCAFAPSPPASLRLANTEEKLGGGVSREPVCAGKREASRPGDAVSPAQSVGGAAHPVRGHELDPGVRLRA